MFGKRGEQGGFPQGGMLAPHQANGQYARQSAPPQQIPDLKVQPGAPPSPQPYPASRPQGSPLPAGARSGGLPQTIAPPPQKPLAGMPPRRSDNYYDIKSTIFNALIDAIDDWGYMRADPHDIAARMGAPDAEVLRVLRIMQTFEPTGVMARDIPECLALQLKERGRFDPAMEKLVQNLDLLAKGHFDRLLTICGVDRDDLTDMIAEVRALTPKPGAGFGGGAVQSVAPDVYVKQAPDGTWMVELNADTMPRVLMNQRY